MWQKSSRPSLFFPRSSTISGCRSSLLRQRLRYSIKSSSTPIFFVSLIPDCGKNSPPFWGSLDRPPKPLPPSRCGGEKLQRKPESLDTHSCSVFHHACPREEGDRRGSSLHSCTIETHGLKHLTVHTSPDLRNSEERKKDAKRVKTVRVCACHAAGPAGLFLLQQRTERRSRDSHVHLAGRYEDRPVRERSAGDGEEFSRLRQRQILRWHNLSSCDSEFHDPGRRVY